MLDIGFYNTYNIFRDFKYVIYTENNEQII